MNVSYLTLCLCVCKWAWWFVNFQTFFSSSMILFLKSYSQKKKFHFFARISFFLQQHDDSFYIYQNIFVDRTKNPIFLCWIFFSMDTWMIHRQENGLRNPFEYNVNNDQEDRLGGHLPVCLFVCLVVCTRFMQISHHTHRHILMIIIIIIIISLQRYDTHTTAIIIMLMNNDR